jgi:hypothetical protein
MNVRNSTIKQSGPASLSVITQCPLCGVPLYIYIPLAFSGYLVYSS